MGKKYLLFYLILMGFVHTGKILAKETICDNNKEKYSYFTPGELWKDNNHVHINAHGGGVLFYNGKYYWFGEHKSETSSAAYVGVTCYSSSDLYNWEFEKVALPVMKESSRSDIEKGCTIERPKVIYNEKTKKFVMFFHLELKGQGYEAARVGIATSNNVTGPYKFQKSYRPCAGYWPVNMTDKQKNAAQAIEDFPEWWTNEWKQAITDGMFVRRDFKGGQMSRDMTLFIDDDGKAYHIYSSEENLTLHIAELTDDYQSHSGKYIRFAPAGHNEAPAIFKKDNTYFMITSGCTGWEPNAARLFSASSIWGPWTEHPNPCKGKGADLTFHSQSTYVLPVQGKKDAFIFMGDRWTPKNPIDARYIWLPVLFENGLPVLKWMDKWDLEIFDETTPDWSEPREYEGWNLIWNDEFNYERQPDTTIWNYETGFARNEEDQWYQKDNAICKEGILTISGELEHRLNPQYIAGSNNWRTNRKYIRYTSSSINTRGTKEFLYGRLEVRAKIPTAKGAWPAIWTLGVDMEWPSSGEIDIMEYYQINKEPHILANAAWGTEQPYNAKWNTKAIPFKNFIHTNPNWNDKFHIWRMDWDEKVIRLYLDDELLNETFLKDTQNGSLGEFKNPFMQPHYVLLNLAIGGTNGGKIDDSAFPMKYQIDYVRIYQKQK